MYTTFGIQLLIRQKKNTTIFFACLLDLKKNHIVTWSPKYIWTLHKLKQSWATDYDRTYCPNSLQAEKFPKYCTIINGVRLLLIFKVLKYMYFPPPLGVVRTVVCLGQNSTYLLHFLPWKNSSHKKILY